MHTNLQDGLSAEDIKTGLRTHDINVSVSSIASTRIDFEARSLLEVVRASVHYYNTEEEVGALVECISNL